MNTMFTFLSQTKMPKKPQLLKWILKIILSTFQIVVQQYNLQPNSLIFSRKTFTYIFYLVAFSNEHIRSGDIYVCG